MKSISIAVAFVLALGALLASLLWRRHDLSRPSPKQTLAPTSLGSQDTPSAETQSNLTKQLPNILPGDSCDRVRALYGKETEGDKYYRLWQKEDLIVSLQPSGPDCVIKSLSFTVTKKHTAITPDGIILGRDTIADASEKLKSRMAGSSPFIWQGEGQVHAALELPPTKELPFKASYDSSMNETTVKKLQREPVLDDFTTETIDTYAVDTEPVHEKGVVP